MKGMGTNFIGGSLMQTIYEQSCVNAKEAGLCKTCAEVEPLRRL
jgi:hypothetical protein